MAARKTAQSKATGDEQLVSVEPLTLVRASGHLIYVYQGGLVPAHADQDDVDRLVEEGYLGTRAQLAEKLQRQQRAQAADADVTVVEDTTADGS